jgi:zinc ribbon protein
VFCPKCGKELSDDAQFCIKCGHGVGTGSGASVAQPTKSSHTGMWVLLILLAGALIWFLWNVQNRSHGNTAIDGTRVSTLPNLISLPRAQVITNTAITVKAAGYDFYKFTVPLGATNVSVDGHFSATGGAGNDIEVVILNEDNFANFQNHHDAQTYYNSGKVTQDSIHAVLAGGGTYYLVFNNGFSLLTPKAVAADATLHFTN